MKDFSEFGVCIPKILLPKEKDLSSWSVIACDQYTQDVDYWKNVEKKAEGKNSTLNLIFPEVYLNSPDKKERIQKIKENMSSYINGNVFDEEKEELMYVERTSSFGRTRKGLVCAIDLETYDWKPFSKNLIRATEATIVERIPPRKEIRSGAPLELPHIMLLVNDPKDCLMKAAAKCVKAEEPVYSGDLMMNAGSIKGFAISDEKKLSKIHKALKVLKKKNTSKDGSSFLFAVGDGNHSLATAKSCWEEEKTKDLPNRNVRYALVEIVNIYDEGLTFEPIHRVIFNADGEKLVGFIAEKIGGNVKDVQCHKCIEKNVKSSKSNFGFMYVKDGKLTHKVLETEISELAVSNLQPVLDEFLKLNEGCEIDYIHGADEVLRLGNKENAVAIMLPPVAKDSFFETINSKGPLPRKSFSMGEADEKRFYLESRKLY